MKNNILKSIKDHKALLNKLDIKSIETLAKKMIKVIKNGGKIYWCGNGGSAADAQHLAAELVARFKINRFAIASVALTTDTSVITAIGNDFGFEYIFSRQVEALITDKDLLIAISTSGNSENVLNAIYQAIHIGATIYSLTGNNGGKMAAYGPAIIVPSKDTARIQEMHILIGHILCDLVEQNV